MTQHKQGLMSWYAMRVTYRRELSVKKKLDEMSIENFIPLHYVVSAEKNRKKRELVPAISGLIFVRTSRSIIQNFKFDIPYLQYITKQQGGRNIPIIIPDKQMRDFMAVAGCSEKLIYLKPEELNLAKGTEIRIHGGPFDGVVATYIKIKGTRNKQIVISIPYVISVAISIAQFDLIEILS